MKSTRRRRREAGKMLKSLSGSPAYAKALSGRVKELEKTVGEYAAIIQNLWEENEALRDRLADNAAS